MFLEDVSKMINLIYMDTADRNTDELHQRKIDKNNQLLFKKVFDINNLSKMYPYSIEIETINRCNNDCSFCPVNRNNDNRPLKKMSEELYKKIIDQLADLNYTGYLSLFSNNEPLIDKRITAFLDYARKRLPSARLCLFTNGILLTNELYEVLIEKLNYLVIDNYSDEMKMIPSVEELYCKYKNEKTKCDVKIYIRKKTQVLSSRGGESPNRTIDVTYESGCMMPLMQIVVRPDGKISKCCQDGLGISTIGDLTKETLIQAFQNKARNCLCNELIENGRAAISGCKHCDVFGHDNYMPPEWKPLIISQFIDIVSKHYFNKKKIILVGTKDNRKRIKELLQKSGIIISSEYECLMEVIANDNYFYVLDSYVEPFLSKLDPKSDLVGEAWISCEKIPEYIIHDSSAQIYKFADILERILNNFDAVYYYGDDETWDYINHNMTLPNIEHLQLLSDEKKKIKMNSIIIVNKITYENEELIKKTYNLPEKKILHYEILKEFMDSI